MFQSDVETLERLAAQPVNPKPGGSWGSVWSHGAVAVVAALLGAAGGARTAGDGRSAVKPADPVVVAPGAIKPLTYAEAFAKAAKDNLPLVVGVQTAPPAGAWVSCRVDEWWPEAIKAGFTNAPQVVVSKGGPVLATLPQAATAEDVAKVIAAPQAVPVQFGGPVRAPVRADVCIGGNCRGGR